MPVKQRILLRNVLQKNDEKRLISGNNATHRPPRGKGKNPFKTFENFMKERVPFSRGKGAEGISSGPPTRQHDRHRGEKGGLRKKGMGRECPFKEIDRGKEKRGGVGKRKGEREVLDAREWGGWCEGWKERLTRQSDQGEGWIGRGEERGGSALFSIGKGSKKDTPWIA